MSGFDSDPDWLERKTASFLAITALNKSKNRANLTVTAVMKQLIIYLTFLLLGLQPVHSNQSHTVHFQVQLSLSISLSILISSFLNAAL